MVSHPETCSDPPIRSDRELGRDIMNDSTALKEETIGLFMGFHGTEVAKESPYMFILDDIFTTMVTVLRWVSCVYENWLF